MLFTPTVDSIIKDFTNTINKLESLGAKLNGKATSIDDDVRDLQEKSTALKAESTRAWSIANKIKHLVSE